MFHSRLRRLPLLLAAASCAALVVASLGADEAWAGTCGTANINFELGSTATNSCSTSTNLSTSASPGLRVSDPGVGAAALEGFATATTGEGLGTIGVTNSTGAYSYGVLGQLNGSSAGAKSAGVYGVSFAAGGYGVRGQADSNQAGLFETIACDCPALVARASTGGLPGVQGNGAVGVQGIHLDGSGAAPGVEGVTQSGQTDASGVRGIVASNSPGAGSAGVWGINNGSATNAAGVYGSISSNAANAAGVRGFNGSASCCGMGVAGFHAGQGIGVYGESPNGFAVSGFSPNNWSGFFQGSVNVVGTLFKSSGAFRIDHPLDPAHKYLQHSFVESPEMKNVYDGNVTTDSKGFATVTLPAWFQALNRDFRYQLTVIDKAHWQARAAVWEKIRNNRFTIRTDQPHVQISWQVTGIRHDRYANAHRIQVVVPKEGKADGRYVHPELYGKPLTKSVVVLPGMAKNAPSSR
jgi:hypothetical protein